MDMLLKRQQKKLLSFKCYIVLQYHLFLILSASSFKIAEFKLQMQLFGYTNFVIKIHLELRNLIFFLVCCSGQILRVQQPDAKDYQANFFGEILTNKSVGIFISSSFARMIGFCKKKLLNKNGEGFFFAGKIKKVDLNWQYVMIKCVQ